jgi:hypothetical protein
MAKRRKVKSEHDAIFTASGGLVSIFFMGVVYVFKLSLQIADVCLKLLWLIFKGFYDIIISLLKKEDKNIVQQPLTIDSPITLESTTSSQTNKTGRGALIELYEDYYPKLIDSLKNISAFDRKISYPLLINPSDEYFTLPFKMMIVGKETHFWQLSEHDGFIKDRGDHSQIVEQLLSNYKTFNLGEHYNRSPFWDFCHKLNVKLNGKGTFIWNNVIKVDEGGTTPSWEVMKASTAFYPILQQEIKILNPDIVVFLTGPKLDAYLLHLFPGLVSNSLNDHVNRLSHPLLPINTYRTHHPNRSRLLKEFDRIIECIYNDIKGIKAVQVNKESNKDIAYIEP